MSAKHPTSATVLDEQPRLAPLIPMIKNLIGWQLLVCSMFAIAIAAHAIYLAPQQQQRQLESQAMELQKILQELPWAQLADTESHTGAAPIQAVLQAVLQAALAGAPALLDISLQAGSEHWRAQVEPGQPAAYSNAQGARTSRPVLRAKMQFALPHTPGNESVNATLVMLAIPNTGLHSGILTTGFALLLVISIIVMYAINQQLRTEIAALVRKLPGQTAAAIQSPAVPDPTAAEAANKLLLQPLDHAVERTVAAMQALKHKPAVPAVSSNVSQRELELAQQSAVRASRIKSNIIAKTSHELLTPLNSIAGFSAILARDTQAGTQNQEFAQLIHDNAQQLNTLVNDLIVFSDRETNVVKLHYQPTNLYTLLASIAKSFAPAIAEHGLVMRTDFDSVKNFLFDTDPVRVRQIVSNLLANALRNTEHGEIGITALFEDSHKHSKRVQIAVSDTGCGIDAAKQKSIFNEFVSGPIQHKTTVSRQPDTDTDTENTLPTTDATAEGLATATTGNFSQDAGLGFGLGLAIVDDLCQRMGASITLASAINQGTTFTINLPARNIVTLPGDNTAAHHPAFRVAQPRHAHTQEKNSPDKNSHYINETANGPRTLVVDDNQGNRILLQHLLNTSGCHCDTAASGEQALDLLLQQTYAWLFIDIRMQPINGFEMCNKIRDLPMYNHTPIVACTAHTSDDEYRQLIDSGFDAVLHKPISEHRLAEIFDQFKKAVPGLATDHQKTVTSQPPQSKSASTPPVYQVQAAIQHTGGDPQVAKSICLLIIEELASALELQRRGFACHSDRLEHFHQLNGSASMGGTPGLNHLLHVFESRLKVCQNLSDSLLAQQQKAVEEHQVALLKWLRQQDIDALFDTA